MSRDNTFDFGLSLLPIRIREIIDLPYEVDKRYAMLMTSSTQAQNIIDYSLRMDKLSGLAWAALLEEIEVWWL